MNGSVSISKESQLQMDRLFAGSEKLYNRSVYRSIKKAVKGTKTDETAAVRKHYNLKKRAVTKRIDAHGPKNYRNLSGRVTAASKPISLTSFKRTRQVNAGVKAQVEVGSGAKLIPRAFIQRAKGAKQAFWRVRKGIPDRDIWPDKKKLKRPWGQMSNIQYPQGSPGSTENLRQLTVPRITDIFSDPAVIKEIQTMAGGRLEKELKHQIDLALREL